jgi:hypothetical protein
MCEQHQQKIENNKPLKRKIVTVRYPFSIVPKSIFLNKCRLRRVRTIHSTASIIQVMRFLKKWRIEKQNKSSINLNCCW